MSPPNAQTAFNDRIEAQFSELKTMLAEIADRQRAMELREAGCSPLMGSKVDAAFRRIDEHQTQIAELKVDIKKINETLGEIRQTNKILSWLGGLLASTLILWLLNQFLHLL